MHRRDFLGQLAGLAIVGQGLSSASSKPQTNYEVASSAGVAATEIPDREGDKLPSVHRLFELRGTPRNCGRDYGVSQAEAITCYLLQEVQPNEQRLQYAAQCWPVLREWEPPVVEFVRGMAEGSGHSLEEMTLLLLHEEITHIKHCTALGATGRATRDGAPLIGQNWDWGGRAYAWPSLLRLRTDGGPAILTYTFPGLWASAGMNEFGMSLVWTSGGFFPLLAPEVGVPTYALIAGVLGCRNCQEALALLKRTPNAGCFIFLLADGRGEVWVVEALPKRIEAVRCPDVTSRANHFECEPIVRLAKQAVPEASLKANSAARGPRMAQLVREYEGRIDGKVAEKLLRDHGVKLGLDICQHPVPGRDGITVDSMYALPAKKEFWIARGYPCRHRYARYTVT